MYNPAPGSPYIEPIIFVEVNKLDLVHSFAYLGSNLSERCSLDREISFRIERASRSFSALNKRVWSQHGIKLHTKIIVYKVWRPSCMQARLEHSINTNSNFLRVSIDGAWDRYFISNGSPMFQTDVLGNTGLPSIPSMVMKSCVRWVGHIVRMDDDRLPRQLFYGEMWEGKRSALKPKKRFINKILPVTIWTTWGPTGKNGFRLK